jgi:hypothetical protein
VQYRMKGADHARRWHLRVYLLRGCKASFVTLLFRIAKARQDDTGCLTTNRLVTVHSLSELPGFPSFHHFELAFGVKSLLFPFVHAAGTVLKCLTNFRKPNCSYIYKLFSVDACGVGQIS